MTAYELNNELGYNIVGDDVEIRGIAYYDEADEEDIAVAFNKKEIEKTKARVILCHPILTPVFKTIIVTYEDLGYSISKICDVFIKNGVVENYTKSRDLKITSGGYYIGDNDHIAKTATIYPGAIIGDRVTISEGCVIEPYVFIGGGTYINENVVLGAYSKVGSESFFHYKDNSGELGQFYGIGRTIIGKGTHIGSNSVVERGTLSDTIIGENCMIGNAVDIGHDVKIGNNCKIVSQTGIAGRVVIGNNVTIYGQVGISNSVVIGNNVVVKAKSLVDKSIDDGKIIFGMYSRSYAEEVRKEVKIKQILNKKGE